MKQATSSAMSSREKNILISLYGILQTLATTFFFQSYVSLKDRDITAPAVAGITFESLAFLINAYLIKRLNAVQKPTTETNNADNKTTAETHTEPRETSVLISAQSDAYSTFNVENPTPTRSDVNSTTQRCSLFSCEYNRTISCALISVALLEGIKFYMGIEAGNIQTNQQRYRDTLQTQGTVAMLSCITVAVIAKQFWSRHTALSVNPA